MLPQNKMQNTYTLGQVQQAIATRKKTLQPKLIFLSFLLLAVCVLALNAGAVDVNVMKWLLGAEQNALQQTVLWEIRAPRMLMTVLSGAGLALCGTVLQAICRNPLADPGLIGVSSGAALFAGIAMALLASSSAWSTPVLVEMYLIPISAFIGACLSLLLVLKIANAANGMSTLLLILAGVAINAGAMSILGVIQYMVDDATLRQITFWSMGSYSGITYSVVFVTLVPVIVGAVYFWKIKQALMLLSCSEKQAKYQGVDTHKVKMTSLWLVAAIVAVCVSFTGIVGFVGLVVPHVCRMLIGAHLKILLPASMISGGLLVGLADIAARTLIIPAELPIGIITSIVGVPFFLYLIVREKRKFSYV